MKLLVDQNLSPRLARVLADIYPDSVHVREIQMRDATDTRIWEHARTHDFVIVSKDSDFQGRVCFTAARRNLAASRQLSGQSY